MSKKRGSRGSKSHDVVLLKARNEAQLQRTLDLCGVVGEKPLINDYMESYMSRLAEEERRESALDLAYRWRYGKHWSDAMIYDCMGEDDYPIDVCFDDLGNYSVRELKALNKKLFKRQSRGNKKRNRRRYHVDDEDVYDEPEKLIKFYSDIENELSVREFHSLKEFNDFCADNGYIMSATDYNNLLNWSVVHCCLDPISEEYGETEIITDNSYGGLYWTVSEDIVKEEQNALNARTFTD